MSEEARPSAAEPTPESRPEGALTLAQAFALMRRALGELAGPVPHDALRLRMVTLHGRQDPLLEPARFARLLRQAHDAEVANVRKLSEHAYEIESRQGEESAAPSPALAKPPTDLASPPALTALPPLSLDNGQRPALRFRRGSRVSGGRPEIPMVGVVRMEGEESKDATKPHRRGSRKSPAAADGEPAAKTPVRKRAPRVRARKKAE